MDLIELALSQAFAKATTGTAAAYAAAAAQSAREAASAATTAAETAVAPYIAGMEYLQGETVTITGSTPTITAIANGRYICGEVTSLSFTPCAEGICDVVFESGSTPTVLTLPNGVVFPAWFDATALEANTTYEINILDGVYGAVTLW